MTLLTVQQMCHHLLQQSIEPGDTVVDATMGNGNDTLFLCQTVGNSGQVFAFDIQELAIKNTAALLKKENYQNATLILDGHENLTHYISKDMHISGAVFNLGYLPKSDKSVQTNGNTTITAINQILQLLKPNGIITIVVYYGHDDTQQEKNIVDTFCKQLDQKLFHVLKYDFINQQNHPPYLIAIQKRK